jgi:hypothetical protein
LVLASTRGIREASAHTTGLSYRGWWALRSLWVTRILALLARIVGGCRTGNVGVNVGVIIYIEVKFRSHVKS